MGALASATDQNKKWKKLWSNPFVLLISVFVAVLLSQTLSSVLVGSFSFLIPDKNIQLAMLVTSNIIVFGGMLVAAMQLVGFSPKAFGWTIPSVKYIALVPVAFLIYAVLSGVFMTLMGALFSSFDIEQTQEIGFKQVQGFWQLLPIFISLVIITPVYEELLFRGLLFKGFRVRLPFWLAAMVGSIIFAAMHGQWNVAVDTFALSALLCYMTEKSGSIIPAIMLHALKNGLAFTLLFIVKV